MHTFRRTAALSMLFATLVSCSSTEDTITLPANANQLKNRSVRIDVGQCVTMAGTPVACAGDAVPADGLKGVDLRGVNGTALLPVVRDQGSDFAKNFGQLNPFWHRVPVGYGCAATLQGLFDNKKAFDDPTAYNFTALDQIYKSVVDAGGDQQILWTAAYDLGDGSGKCTYANGQQQGAPIADPAKWAKVVRQIARHYDRDLPDQHKTECNAIAAGQPRPWYCTYHLFHIEFLRDPFGAGGYTQATKEQWLQAYKAFATELRQEFPLPGNDVALIGPSVVIHSFAELQNQVPGTTRSPIYDFIDRVVADKIPLTYLSFEVEADSPTEVQAIASMIKQYAATKGLHHEKSFAGKTGTEPIPLFVTDLRLTKSNFSSTFAKDPVRMSAYRGGFYAASKILLQGIADAAVVSQAPRVPTIDTKGATVDDVAKSARSSDDFWFDEKLPDGTAIPNGTLKPAAWHHFWFNFMGGRQIVGTTQGPDASGTGTADGKPAKPDLSRGIVVMATKETCLDANKNPTDCVVDSSTDASIRKGRQHIVRVILADLDIVSESKQDTLEHILRIDVSNILKDAKTVGYQWAFLNPVVPTWTQPLFTESGVLDASNGEFHVTLKVATPSVHYLQFIY